VPCDNLVDNGPTVARVVTGLAAAVDDDLAAWVARDVSFVSTTIDRITPATTPEDREVVAKLSGFADAAPVVTEPFSEWVLAGDFPSGRPAWERGGARFVSDVGAFEQRKLWLLNGAHSLLAYAGPTRGHTTVAEAITDPVCRRWVDAWWDEAARHLPLPADDITRYREDLLERFTNPRIRHALAQIAMDGSQKLPIRVLPVLTRERADGRLPEGGVHALAGWLAHLRDGSAVRDPRGEELRNAVAGTLPDATRRMLLLLDASLADDRDLVEAVETTCRALVR
jgi:fructuronate reductase